MFIKFDEHGDYKMGATKIVLYAQCFQKYLSAVAFLKKRKLCEMAKISKEMQLDPFVYVCVR